MCCFIRMKNYVLDNNSVRFNFQIQKKNIIFEVRKITDFLLNKIKNVFLIILMF